MEKKEKKKKEKERIWDLPTFFHQRNKKRVKKQKKNEIGLFFVSFDSSILTIH